MFELHKKFGEEINKYNECAPKYGIGTLKERCLHSIIKNFYDSDKSHQEIKLCGYVADIFDGEKITEIQTNNFSSLNAKLEKYLQEYKVTVVYPVSHIKHIVWLEPETGEITARNKSPKTGSGIEFLFEASRIKKHLNHPNLRFEILLIDMDEYKLLNGWDKSKKRGSIRIDRKPISLYDIITIDSPSDIKKILPPDFPSDSFDYKEFEKITKLKRRTARYSLNTLLECGIISQIGKDCNKSIYRLN